MISKLLTDDMRVPNHYPFSIQNFKALGKSSPTSHSVNESNHRTFPVPGEVNAILSEYEQPVSGCARQNKKCLADFLGLQHV